MVIGHTTLFPNSPVELAQILILGPILTGQFLTSVEEPECTCLDMNWHTNFLRNSQIYGRL